MQHGIRPRAHHQDTGTQQRRLQYVQRTAQQQKPYFFLRNTYIPVRTCTSSTYLSVGSTNKVETAQYIAFEFNAQHNLAIAKTSERCTVSCIAAAAVVHNTELDNEIHIIAADRSQREEGDTASLRRGDLSLFTTHVIMIGDILPLIWAPRRDRAESRKLLTKHRQLIILLSLIHI